MSDHNNCNTIPISPDRVESHCEATNACSQCYQVRQQELAHSRNNSIGEQAVGVSHDDSMGEQEPINVQMQRVSEGLSFKL